MDFFSDQKGYINVLWENVTLKNVTREGKS